MNMKPTQEKNGVDGLVQEIPDRENRIVCTGLDGPAQARFIQKIHENSGLPVCLILPSPKIVDGFIENLQFFERDAAPLLTFPSYNISPFKFVSYHNQTAAERIRVLYQLTDRESPPLLVTTAEALIQKIVPKQEILEFAELVLAEEEIDRDGLIEKLVSGGYTRAAIVEEAGDFSVRGGILDIFSPLYSEPLRIELFGDLVESIRLFSASSQRTLQDIAEAVILPAREVILKMAEIDAVVHRIREQAVRCELPPASTREIVDRIKKEGIFPGIESLIPILYPQLDTLFDYLPPNTLFVLSEPEQIEQAVEDALLQAVDNHRSALTEKRLCIEPERLYLKWSDTEARLRERRPLSLKRLPITPKTSEESEPPLHVPFTLEETTGLKEELKQHREKERENLLLPLVNRIHGYRKSGYSTFLVCGTRSQAERLGTLLSPYGLQPTFLSEFPEHRKSDGRLYICLGRLTAGFVWPEESLAIITEQEIFGHRPRKGKVRRKSVRTELLTFEDLKQGELVVHAEQGIGRYEGLVKLKLNGTENDFLFLRYKDDDKLYLPVDRMSMIQKYMGVDGIEPVLDKMGGISWAKTKEKVKKSVEKMAGDLLKIYAERKVRTGTAFESVGRYFQDFEAGFPYEETPDQRRAIEAVLNDMAQPTPMDRLVCGDVGYGKTEVALRAAFMAAFNSKQVAVLVPTTVLAEQHFETFSQRFQDYPVTVACLSRFRSPKEQREIVEGLKTGKVDIVVGTHRLLQKDIEIKDLGLAVIDEEQRFGVRHKEKLKQLRTTVDVLALTATPIPRTLHLSLVGIRDISIISTPPEDRRAILTYISELDDRIIADAIRNEIKRGGQVFFVHNIVQTIGRMADHLQELVPEVRLDIAHGQMAEDDLEKVMFRFVNREIDLLVCTTIIESGLDVPAANTILINRADRFGLSQIYQLRGRVGRAGEQAYAYLFIPKESALTRDAQKRLKVLMEHTDLGAGFQIAMSDLKIRGGGAILGASQSGHIAAVGYDMFLKLMEDSVSELKGEPVVEDLEPEINLPLSAFLSETYIPDIDQRLTAYRRLSRMTDLKEISDFKAEMIDRFGPLPDEAGNLLLKIMLKTLSVKAGVKRLDMTDGRLALHFSEVHQKNPFGIVDLITGAGDRFVFTPEHVLKADLSRMGPGNPLAHTKNILKEITQHVNG